MRRLILIGAGVALAGAAVAGGVARASGGQPASAASNRPGTGVAHAVRTNLIATVQVGGSLGYDGSYTIVAPNGSSVQQVTQAQQAVARDEQALSADQAAASADLTSSNRDLSNDQSALTSAQSALSADTAHKSYDCAGSGAAGEACSQDTQKVAQDQSQVDQAQQALTTARSNAARSALQDQAKVSGDTTQLGNDQSSLADLEQRELAPGSTYTSLPSAGQVISQDQAVYSLDGQAVPLLYGTTPAYRAFRQGMSDGPDVSEVNRDLIALGFESGVPPSSHYSSVTAAAVSKWQASLGLPQTGTILLGQVVFEPGPIRVTAVTPSPGQAVNPGSILNATSTTRVVTVALSVNQEYLVHAGYSVTIVLPDGRTTVPGHIEAISTVASSSNNGNGGNGGNNGNGGGNGGNSNPTVNVTITLDNPSSSGNLDQAPVNVNITTMRADGVLAVPINALLALEGGGDGVEVISGSDRRLVGVQTGLFSSTMVQISGPGIAEGTAVEVPSS